MAAAASHMVPTGHDSPISSLAPLLLSSLQTISSGQRPLSKAQSEELAESKYKDRFLDYIKSPLSAASKPTSSTDLRYPLSNYFINSSHNTYLTGNQLYSGSSTASYTNALLRGCRCIEIDVWNGSPLSPPADSSTNGVEDKKHHFKWHSPRAFFSRKSSKDKDDKPLTIPGVLHRKDTEEMPAPWTSGGTVPRAEPIVVHGFTLTKEIPFRDVCSAIKDAAFVTSDLPIIVSLEVHAGPEQQEVMVEIIKTKFRKHLLPPPGDGDVSLPTPASLRNKILIKVKYVDPQKAAKKAGEGTNDSLKIPSLSKRLSKTSIRSEGSKRPSLRKTKSTDSTDSSSSSSDNADTPSPEEPKRKSAIIPELSALGIYTRSYHFSDLTHPEALIPTHVFSLSEKKLMEVHESNGPTLFSHNRNFLMRAFPSGMRVRSDNLDPSVFWRKGVQIVALNWQKWDRGMMLNAAMFDGSGGWVLKPKGYLGDNKIEDDDPDTLQSPKVGDIKEIGWESQADVITRKTLNLSLTILAAQNLPLPPSMKHTSSFKPYLKVELHVEKPSERSGEPIENNGKVKEEEDSKFKYSIRPDIKGSQDVDFAGRRVEYKEVLGVVEELSFLRIKVMNDEMGKDPLAAWTCIRLDRLRDGWRLVRLLNAAGEKSEGILLVGIEKSLV